MVFAPPGGLCTTLIVIYLVTHLSLNNSGKFRLWRRLGHWWLASPLPLLRSLHPYRYSTSVGRDRIEDVSLRGGLLLRVNKDSDFLEILRLFRLLRRDHQEKHWKIHKKTCFARSHKNPSVMDEAVKYLLRVHDVAIVDIAVGALLKNDVNVDFRREFERQAVFLTIEQRENEETMADAHAAGHTPTIKITEDVCTVLIEEMATQLLGKDCQSFENPDDRKVCRLWV